MNHTMSKRTIEARDYSASVLMLKNGSAIMNASTLIFCNRSKELATIGDSRYDQSFQHQLDGYRDLGDEW